MPQSEPESTETTAQEEKAELRCRVKARLSELSPEQRELGARRMADRVMAELDTWGAQGVFLCLSFGLEIDTWGLVDRLSASGRRVYVPRAVSKTRRLHVHPYPCALRRLSFGLRQPTSGAPELPAEQIDQLIDVALVSALAFDPRGYRLGYGGGFFDRFLNGRPFRKVGLAFEVQQIDRLPVEDHDVPMDSVVYG